MDTITVCYSAHRPETVQLTARVMQDHQVIILEEPTHPDFTDVLRGNIKIQEHLLELDVEYPEFIMEQYQLLQGLFRKGRTVFQIEPYLECLLRIQLLFADGMKPEDIKPETVEESVYIAERNATAKLIAYYEATRGEDFQVILTSMNTFAQADAARFVLRDRLRAKKILGSLTQGRSTYIEAGSIHLLLFKLLAENLSKSWKLSFYSADREAIQQLNSKGTLFSPGDILTLHYIWGNDLLQQRWQRYCAQALIYAKIVIKEEISAGDSVLSHTRNEIDSIAIVSQLSLSTCRKLFYRIRALPSKEAAKEVQRFVEMR